MSSKLPQRRSIRFANYDYSQVGLYFVTICCENKICRLGKIQNTDIVLNEAGRMINTEWNNLKKRFSNIELYYYAKSFSWNNRNYRCRDTPCGYPKDEWATTRDCPYSGQNIGSF